MSIITYFEIKRGLLAVNTVRKLKIFEELCPVINILWIDTTQIGDKASEIYVDLKQRGCLIQDADIWIAATALTQMLIVVTHDFDFNRVQNLNVED